MNKLSPTENIRLFHESSRFWKRQYIFMCKHSLGKVLPIARKPLMSATWDMSSMEDSELPIAVLLQSKSTGLKRQKSIYVVLLFIFQWIESLSPCYPHRLSSIFCFTRIQDLTKMYLVLLRFSLLAAAVTALVQHTRCLSNILLIPPC